MQMNGNPPRVVFVAAAGPRRGYGHLVRCRSLACAIGVQPVVALRGGVAARRAAEVLGCRTLEDGPVQTLERERPQVVVIDDPVLAATSPWRRAARRANIPICSIHDLGIGVGDADLLVDASLSTVTFPGRTTASRLIGPSFAILSCLDHASPRRLDPDAGGPCLLVALGGGPRLRFAMSLAREVRRSAPDVRIVIAGGFTNATLRNAGPRIEMLGPQQSLTRHLLSATACVVGGGVTLYEACCLGVPAVAVSVVPAQQGHIRPFAERGAVIDGGPIAVAPAGRREERARAVASEAVRLLQSPYERNLMARQGSSMVDGLGARRVACHIATLVRAGAAAGAAA